jgi:hypothetical protein
LFPPKGRGSECGHLRVRREDDDVSILTALAVGACLGVWLDIAIDRWGDTLLDTYIGRGVSAIFEYVASSLLLTWELVRFDLPERFHQWAGRSR